MGGDFCLATSDGGLSCSCRFLPGLLQIRQLLFRNYSLDVLRLAPDAVSKASICLDGHTLNNRVNHWSINRRTTSWTLGLMANVFIQLVGMGHASTFKIWDRFM
jgi:hypothetical protein